MYEDYYGLNGKPFNLTPDPRFLFLSEKHREAFAHLVYGIKNRSGFVMISGEVGTGKTTLCRSLLNQLDDETDLAFIFNPMLSPVELLSKVIDEFGIESNATQPKELIDDLNVYLLKQATEGRNCVLVIDEAQDLSADLLEQVRLLSNLETETQKLMQIVLIGQPELAEKLQLPELRQLNQRITARYHLEALDHEETLQYVAYRLRIAGGRRQVRFTRKAIRTVFRQSKGIPRVINSLCDRSLLIGYTLDSHTITPTIVRRAGREIRGRKIPKRRGSTSQVFKRNAYLVGGLTLAAIVVLFVTSGSTSLLEQGSDALRRAWTTTTERVAPPPDAQLARATSEDLPDTSSNEEEIPNPVLSVIDEPQIEETITEEARRTIVVGDAWWTEQDAQALLRGGMDTIFGLWDHAAPLELPDNPDASAFATLIEQAGLASLHYAPTLENILAVNLPFFTPVAIKSGRLWLSVVSTEEEGIGVAVGPDEVVVISAEAFAARYANEVVVPWRDPAPDSGPILSWSTGPKVRLLREELVSLGFLEGEQSDDYDAHTIEAVRRIQNATGLPGDGIAGEQTRMILTSWGNTYATPTLNVQEMDFARAVSLEENDIIADPSPEEVNNEGEMRDVIEADAQVNEAPEFSPVDEVAEETENAAVTTPEKQPLQSPDVTVNPQNISQALPDWKTLVHQSKGGEWPLTRRVDVELVLPELEVSAEPVE